MYSCGTCGSKMMVITGYANGWLLQCGEGHALVPTGAEYWVFRSDDDELGDITWHSIQGHLPLGLVLYEDSPISLWDKIRVHFGFEPTPARLIASFEYEQ